MAIAAESHTDVLIIGAGPSGLAAAYWMARYGVKARIVDKRGTKVFQGHADGLRAGTMDLFESMGFQHRILHEGVQLGEFSFWTRDENDRLKRQQRVRSDALDGLPYRTIALGQGRIERFILDTIAGNSDLQIERGVVTESLDYNEDMEENHDDYPITVKLRTLTEQEADTTSAHKSLLRDQLASDDLADLTPSRKNKPGTVEILKAKYLISCDGAHSWTRRQLDIPFTGSTTEHIWGVIDVVPITDFPDVRRASTVESKHGSLLIIPRERQLTRFYVPLTEVEEASGRFDRSSVTLDMIRQKVQEILRPFQFDFKICDWWTTYQVGQRIAQSFTKGRIYLAGDAVHTHSPKVGLGMNVSIQDGFNVGWKVALVAKQLAYTTILDTYESERRRLAEMLVDLDRRWSQLFLKQQNAISTGSQEKIDAMNEILRSTALFAECLLSYYGASPLVDKSEEGIAQNISSGERLIAAKIRNQASGEPSWTTQILRSDGRFRILLLAGDIRSEEQKRRVLAFSRYLSSDDSVLRRFTPGTTPLDSLIDVITIHSAPVEETESSDLPDNLRSLDSLRGWQYDKVWSDADCLMDLQCDGKAYEKWGIDRSKGAILALRPDQHIGWIGQLENVEGLSGYFDGILRQPVQKSFL
ncbi:FAD binding domain-containing protein [Aspergillus avenaceus]|uniref:FAD binding domain-containing protein n=1 Tax=Aspergillus avenaceus TaxID=36643 RepID=A0A5N6U5N6_ASPAV|nr:FAD binding domain-containing protein [Aspergillus avenaceus]